MKILVIAPSWLGDLIMSQSLYKLLKAQDPAAEITLYAPKFMEPIAGRMPEISAFIPNPFAHGTFDLKRRFAEGRRLGPLGFERAYILPNSFKSALIPFFAGIKERIAFRGESRYVVVNRMRCNKQDFPRMVERYAALAFDPAEVKTARDLPPIPYPRLQAQEVPAELRQRLKLNTERPLLALGCGANYGPAKLWPVEYFADISARWIRLGGAVLGLGTNKDGPTVRAICSLVPADLQSHFYDISGQTNLTEALDVAALCRAAVCNDSGMMHTLAALDIPQVDIFGSTSTGYTPPLSDKAVCVEAQTSCHPCFKRTCRFGTYECLKSLPPDRVWSELMRICHV